MNILFDTNVILDALLERAPFYEETILLFDAVEESTINGFICADGIVTRNPKDFKKSKIGIYSQRELLAAINYS